MERSYLIAQQPVHAQHAQGRDPQQWDYYLKETALPAGSLISPQDFWIVATTSGGMGT
jgi:hypothetical protein